MASILPVASGSLFAPLPISSFAGVSSSLPLVAALGLGRTDSSVVELSGSGRLLSAVATFREQLAALRPGQAESGLGQNFGNDLASLAAEAQYFVDAFNGLQQATDGAQGIFDAFGGGVLAGRIAAAQAGQVGATYANGESTLTRLEQLGIRFEPASSAFAGQRLGIDLATLRSAFASDPAGAFALLGKAADAFAGQADGYLAQAADAASALSRWSWLEDSLALSGGLAGNSPAFGLSELLLLGSLGQGNSAGLLQTQLALDQFALVSTLL
ncbi:MAG: hypothetical protein BGO63_12420 [Candidatus Accumulibacter sp. 66-26]|nr:hypothetical protein [Accumulibacter sp.]OJW47392.1 MAG: hypothetical protein BGO63_12420 [Candidatus Accumulibacter sp. 66-26]